MQGAGKQTVGMWVNLLGMWCIGLPSALLLAFPVRLGVKGLWTGGIIGVCLEAAAYLTILSRIDWSGLAAKAAAGAQQEPQEPLELEGA